MWDNIRCQNGDFSLDGHDVLAVVYDIDRQYDIPR